MAEAWVEASIARIGRDAWRSVVELATQDQGLPMKEDDIDALARAASEAASFEEARAICIAGLRAAKMRA